MQAESQILEAAPPDQEAMLFAQLDRLLDVFASALERSFGNGADPRGVLERLGERLSARYPRGASRAALLLRLENIEIDLRAHEVRAGSEIIRLTRREFALLALLVEESDRVLTRDEIFERVWGTEEPYSRRTVDIHIHRLRRKLREPFSERLQTFRGIGYKLRSERAA